MWIYRDKMDNSWCYLTDLWIVISLLITACLSSEIQNIYSSGCTGERINLECPDFHKIAIKRLFYGIKNDTKCAGYGRRHSEDCCQPTHNDCLVVEDTKYPFLNMLCSGQRGCDIESKSMPATTSCQAKGFGGATNYMTVIHDCIPDDDVSFLCTNSHKRGKSVYLSNLNYPHPISAGKQQCQCLIKTGNHVGIDIHALDIIITRSAKGNQCYQDIEIQDEDGHRKEITCGHPGLHAFRKIYNSDVRSVTLTLNNNAPKAQGYIWLQAKAIKENDFIEIYCGDEMKRYLGFPVDDLESRTIDNKNADSKNPKVDVTWLTGGNKNLTRESTPNVVSDMMALIVGVAVAVAMIIIIGLSGIIILCVRRSQQKRSVQSQPPPFPSPMLKNKDDDHFTSTYCKYDYDEDKYCSIKRSPMRLTKFSNMETFGDRKLMEAFSQGVTVPDVEGSSSPTQNGYMNYTHAIASSQNEPLIEKRETTDDDSDSEVIMPKSEYIAIGKAIQPSSIKRDPRMMSLPEKKKHKNKTVTFSPVAMVTPLPSGSEESVPDDMLIDEIKANFIEQYSKTLPSMSSARIASPEKIKKIVSLPETQDDMCLESFLQSSGENITEEDLWKNFHIKLTDTAMSDPMLARAHVNMKTPPPPAPLPVKKEESEEDPDYDENPYDNVPYINLGSLRRNNAPDHLRDMYKDSLKRNISQRPTVESIPEA